MEPREALKGRLDGAASSLAVFRIVVGVVLLRLPDLHAAPRWASLPESVRVPPVGLEAIASVVPITPELARGAYGVLLAAVIAGTVGLATRASWLVVTLVGLYLLGIPQLAGSVFHYHHLLWFAALLAASPSGDALSIDAWIARRRGRGVAPDRHAAYGLPLRFVWILIGLIFFFPGLWKLITSGTEWIWSDNLRNHMWAKWAQLPGFEPIYRVDRHPTLVRVGALGVVLFELSFLPLVLHRRTRLFAVAAALVFHQLTAYLMGLRFPALWLCYVAFVDWGRVAARVRGWLFWDAPKTRVAPTRAPPRPTSTAVVGSVLVAGVLVFGALGISEAWPFACYPKFDRIAPDRLPAMEVALVTDGVERAIPVAHMSPEGRSQRWWALSWSLLGAHERAQASPDRFRSFFRQISSREPLRSEARDATEVRFFRAWITTDPDRRGDPPLSRQLVYVLPLES